MNYLISSRMKWGRKVINPWDQLAPHRHKQLKEGRDITFANVLLPKLKDILCRIDNIERFRVLDIGCGTGFLTEILSHDVKEIMGIDPSQKSISIAKDYVDGNKKIELQCVSIEEFALKHSDEFDLALAHMTLQAIKDMDKAIADVSVVLRANGWFLFSIPHPCFWSLIKSDVGDENFHYHKSSSHENIFRFSEDLRISVPYFHRSLESYSSALSSNGFSILFFSEPFPPDDLMTKYHRPWFYPGFLFVLCRKCESTGKNEH